MRAPTVGLAGWLFADLLLAFGMIFLGIAAALPKSAEEPPSPPPPTSAPPTTPARTTPPPTSPPPPQNLVSIDSICRVLPPDAGVAQLSEDALREELAKLLLDLKDPPRSAGQGRAGPQAKLVITFGYGPTVAAGEKLAAKVNARLREPALTARLGNLLAKAATIDMRENGTDFSPEGRVAIELFVAYDGPLPLDAYPSHEGCVGRATPTPRR